MNSRQRLKTTTPPSVAMQCYFIFCLLYRSHCFITTNNAFSS